VDVKDILRIVLVREVEDRGQDFDIVDQRVTNRVDDLEEHFECFWGIMDVDDVGSRNLLWGREHVSEHRGRNG